MTTTERNTTTSAANACVEADCFGQEDMERAEQGTGTGHCSCCQREFVADDDDTDDDDDIQNFGRYGWRAVGTPKYADVTPHHEFGGAWNYVNTYDPAAEDLLCRIFDDRDPTAEAIVTVVWRGHANGSGGKHYLLRSYSFSAEEVLIPDACVVEFDADLTEDLEDDQVRQICWKAKVRGVRDEDAE